jgi:AcrR family transcriptional regulator
MVSYTCFKQTFAMSATTDPDTHRRLLDAAAEVFAESGFRSATIREICLRAEANVAAVNYHFGDKESLYREVLEDALRSMIAEYPPDLGLPPDPTPEDRLHAFVHSFLLRVLTGSKRTSLMRMMTREMVEPTTALDRLVETVQKPLFRILHGIVTDLCGPDAPPEVVLACAQAVVAQCLFYKQAEHVICRMGHRVPQSSDEIERLAQQITAFSLGGIRARMSGAEG